MVMKRLALLAVAAIAATGLGTAAGLSPSAAPSNDNFASASPIQQGVELRFDNRLATAETGESACSLADSIPQKTLWWKFTAPTAGDYVAYATGSDHDTSVVWNSDITTITGNCNDDAWDSYDAVDTAVTLAGGASQYIQMEPYDVISPGSGSVGVAKVVPASDSFATRVPIPFAAGSSNAVVGLAHTGADTVESGEPVACGSAAAFTSTAWSSFTPNKSGTWMIESKSTASTGLAVYSGSALSSLNLLDCSVGSRIAVVVDLIAGQSYPVQLSTGSSVAPSILRAEPVSIRGMSQKIADVKAFYSPSNSSAVLIDGTRPAVVVSTKQLSGNVGEVVYYERAASGTWSATTIHTGSTTGVTAEVSMALLPNGQPAVAYYDGLAMSLRYAERSTSGVWSDVLVDADGPGTSTDVGNSPDLAILDNGQPAISYYDSTAGSLRFAARSTSGVWADVLVDADGSGAETPGTSSSSLAIISGVPTIIYQVTPNAAGDDTQRIAKLVGTWSDNLLAADFAGSADITRGPDGQWHAVVQGGSDNHSHYGTLIGGTWTFDDVLADRDIAEQGWKTPALRFDRDGNPVVVWGDSNSSDRVGVTRYDRATASWVEEVSVAALSKVGDTNFTGIHDMYTKQIGATVMPDGRIGWLEVDTETGTLHWVEDINRVCPTSPAPFTDVSPTSFAVNDVPCIYGLGITTGTSTTTYGPKSEVNRAQMASFLARTYRALTGEPCAGGTTPFTDVPPGKFYTDDVGCIFSLAITHGTGATTYAPDDDVTREQMAAFLGRLYRAVTKKPCTGSPTFTDVDSSSFAYGDIGCIASLGITTGTSATTYSPDDSVTREQMASFLARLWRTPAAFR